MREYAFAMRCWIQKKNKIKKKKNRIKKGFCTLFMAMQFGAKSNQKTAADDISEVRLISI